MSFFFHCQKQQKHWIKDTQYWSRIMSAGSNFSLRKKPKQPKTLVSILF